MKSLITKKRKAIMKVIIFLQLLWFSFYWLTIEIKFMLYLYMRLVFKPFEPVDYSQFTVIISLCNAVCLMIIVPILSQKLKIHDSMLIAIILATEVVSFGISPFVDVLWKFYIVQAVGAMGYCKYSTVRSMISKCIEPGTSHSGNIDEWGFKQIYLLTNRIGFSVSNKNQQKKLPGEMQQFQNK